VPTPAPGPHVQPLHAAMRSLGVAARAPDTDDGSGRAWVDRVVGETEQVRAAFSAHVDDDAGTGDGGPLEHRVHRLRREHAALEAHLAALAALAGAPGAGPGSLRRPAESVLALLQRHRRRGTALAFDASLLDLGGSG
jgi:hypothetical protein